MLNFPGEYSRVIYDENPLFEVVCQIRFPTILRIGNQDPVDFQDRIRNDYPIFNVSSVPLPEEFKITLRQVGMKLPGESTYEFKSEDESWKVSLNKEFVALTTSKYKKFEEFKERFTSIFSSFTDIYKPSFFSRIGLRYQNLIVRSRLGLEGVDWKEIISKEIASELHNEVMRDSIKQYMKNLIFVTEQEEMLAFRHGIVEATIDKVKEDSYLLDSDFYSVRKVDSNEEVVNIISGFNRSTGRLFRWSISDRLHEAMLPEALDG